MRQHRLTPRKADTTSTPPATSTIPPCISGTSETTVPHSDILRHPVARAYRFKKETSVCGLTCTCCYHTILGRPRRHRSLPAMSENFSSGTETPETTSEVVKEEEPVAVTKTESYPSTILVKCSSTPIKTEESQMNKEELNTLILKEEVVQQTEALVEVLPNATPGVISDAPPVVSPADTPPPRPAEVEHFVTRLLDGKEVHIAAKAPRRKLNIVALANSTYENDVLSNCELYPLTETPKTTHTAKSRYSQAASGTPECFDLTQKESTANDQENVDSSIQSSATKEGSGIDVTRVTRSLSTPQPPARFVRATSPRITRSQTAAMKLTAQSEQRVLRSRNRQVSENSISSNKSFDGRNHAKCKRSKVGYAPMKNVPSRNDDDLSNMGDDEADLDATRMEENKSKPRMASSRRRRRKIITMKKWRRKPPVNSIFGSPLRQKIVVDDWVRDGEGKYTKEAVLLFEKVQLEAEKLRQQKLSVNGCIDTVNLGGRYEIKTSYCGNYPAEYSTLKTLYVCDGCFAYFSQQASQYHHMKKCSYRYAPPGNEIYCDTEKGISVFEVHGKNDAMYCSNLCRLTMLWLENKVIFMDVEPFDFYVLTTFRDGGFCALGYFSKQSSYLKHNLSCFCVFPCYQGKGYGTFLVDFSYMLSRIDGEPSGPERPFSQSGLLVYKKYWCNTLIRYIYARAVQDGWENLRLSLEEISYDTGIEMKDIVESLTDLCSYEWTRNNRSLILKITEQGIIGLGKCIAERNASKLLAKVEYLTPLFEQGVRRNHYFDVKEASG